MTCAPATPTAAGVKLKIELVSPYDYSFPAGVTEHIGFFAAGLEARGHSVSILAPSSADREQLATDHVYRLGSIVRVKTDVVKNGYASHRSRHRSSAFRGATYGGTSGGADLDRRARPKVVIPPLRVVRETTRGRGAEVLGPGPD